MTIEEAIKHCHEKAEEQNRWASILEVESVEREDCLECAKEHEQLATWLEELLEWHKRVEISKNGGKTSIIFEGQPLFITEGHIEALIEYDRKEAEKKAIEQLMENWTNNNDKTN